MRLRYQTALTAAAQGLDAFTRASAHAGKVVKAIRRAYPELQRAMPISRYQRRYYRTGCEMHSNHRRRKYRQ